MKPTVEVAAAILFGGTPAHCAEAADGTICLESGSFLAAKETAGIHPGVSGQEVREELNIRVIVGEMFETIEYKYPEKTVV